MRKTYIVLTIILVILLCGIAIYTHQEKSTVGVISTKFNVEQAAEYSNCAKDWQASNYGDTKPESFYGDSVCTSKLAIKYDDISMCEIGAIGETNGLARSFCIRDFALAKDDIAICTTYLRDKTVAAYCIVNIALHRNDSLLCVSARSYFDVESEQSYFSDMCYDEFAVKQNNPKLCEKMINRTGPSTSALCRRTGVE